MSKRRKLCVNPKTAGADATKEKGPQCFRADRLKKERASRGGAGRPLFPGARRGGGVQPADSWVLRYADKRITERTLAENPLRDECGEEGPHFTLLVKLGGDHRVAGLRRSICGYSCNLFERWGNWVGAA